MGVYGTGKKALYLTERNRSTLPSGTNTLESCKPVCVCGCVWVRDGVCGRKSVWGTEGVIEGVCVKGIMGVCVRLRNTLCVEPAASVCVSEMTRFEWCVWYCCSTE